MAKINLATVVAIAETTFLGALLAWQVARVAPTLGHTPGNLALLAADGLPVILVLVRRPAQAISHSLSDWFTSYTAALAPLLLTPGGHALIDFRYAEVLMILGLFVNLCAKVCLNRSFGLLAANRGVRRTGPYRFIRHPIYAGNALTQIGFVLVNPTVANVALCLACIALQVIRIRAEENLLGQDPAYADYMTKVQYRLAPGLY